MTLAFAMVIIGSAIAIGSIVFLGFMRREAGAGSDTHFEPERDQTNEASRQNQTGGSMPAETKETSHDDPQRTAASSATLNFQLRALTTRRQIVSATAFIGLAVAILAGAYEIYARTNDSGASFSSVRSDNFQEPDLSGTSAYADLLAYANGQSGKKPVAMSPWQREGNSLPDVETMIARLAARLERSPNDPEGWRMLGWSYFNTQKYQLASDAYARAVQLKADSAPYQSAFGEALVKAAGDVVTPKAKEAFDKALKLDASDTPARFYTGLAKQQGGDARGALEDWIALLKDVKPGEETRLDLRKRTLALAEQIGENVSSRLPTETKTAGPGPTKPLKGPTPEDIRSAAAMSEKERTAMIRGMVESLDNRLNGSPRDPEGWIRLIRSRQALRETEKARAALRRARQIFSDSPATLERIIAEAKALGVTIEQ